MLDLHRLTRSQSFIIKAICVHQMDSLKRILSKDPLCETDITLYLLKNDVDEEHFMEDIQDQIEKFNELYNNPDDLRALGKEDISIFTHFLANLEDQYIKEYPNAIRNLWQRLNIIKELSGNMVKAELN